MQVAHKVVEIPGKGLGVVAAEFIPQGTVVWKLNPETAKIFRTENEFAMELVTHGVHGRQFILNHAYGDGEAVYWSNDAGDFVNHSANPNCGGNTSDDFMYALRDIADGEEITESYATYKSPSWLMNRCRAYGVECSEDVAEKYT